MALWEQQEHGSTEEDARSSGIHVVQNGLRLLAELSRAGAEEREDHHERGHHGQQGRTNDASDGPLGLLLGGLAGGSGLFIRCFQLVPLLVNEEGVHMTHEFCGQVLCKEDKVCLGLRLNLEQADPGVCVELEDVGIVRDEHRMGRSESGSVPGRVRSLLHGMDALMIRSGGGADHQLHGGCLIGSILLLRAPEECAALVDVKNACPLPWL
mmetsp:Transcript_52931/g.123401  ORF Transcript_52931/g.123401 Transcript_52931/m.123401 type:complete len:211 (-) Transcript_52931:88-720(-)